ncbi:transmembrane protein 272 [Microcaecilia unicolor]|uniref:Transmembrane protein 272 n=1 Tax=Microcaecilia unicolor TaxID=1415580 RepID=A0A6P7XX54_9AMPH|nr:transmembrane protein 272 [Microcaecilia unicolor]XP_030055270.1 transmembrane protein 272 [Microcaecilia unicolor]
MSASLEKACHQCISIIASNVCFLFALVGFLTLPLSMAFTGMKFMEDCPVQPLIPLYLLVGGVVGSFKVILLLYDSTRMRQLLSKSVVIDDDDDDEYPWRLNAHKYYIHLTLSLFLSIWFILGNYWVFSVYPPNFIPPFHQPQDYCDKTLYIFALGVLVLSHVVLFLVLLCSCVLYWFSKQIYGAVEQD